MAQAEIDTSTRSQTGQRSPPWGGRSTSDYRDIRPV